MRPRKKINLIPRIAACESLMLPKEDLYSAFANPDAPLHLEIGCGKGSFICRMAQTHPEQNFIAMEREENVIISAMELAKEMELTNVRFLLEDADDCLETLFSTDSLSYIYVNFCDPWHKTRHAKRRLTHRSRLQKYRRLLKTDGELRFKSDNEPLYRFSVEEFAASFPPYFMTENLHASEYSASNIMTEYERRFSDLGHPIYSIRSRKSATEESLKSLPTEND